MVKLELKQNYQIPAHKIIPLMAGKLNQSHGGYMLMRVGYAWRKLGLFNIYSLFTSSPFSSRSLNMGIC